MPFDLWFYWVNHETPQRAFDHGDNLRGASILPAVEMFTHFRDGEKLGFESLNAVKKSYPGYQLPNGQRMPVAAPYFYPANGSHPWNWHAAANRWLVCRFMHRQWHQGRILITHTPNYRCLHSVKQLRCQPKSSANTARHRFNKRSIKQRAAVERNNLSMAVFLDDLLR